MFGECPQYGLELLDDCAEIANKLKIINPNVKVVFFMIYIFLRLLETSLHEKACQLYMYCK